jgi:hypothetical protein
MKDFFRDYKWDGRDFLVLGKGPSLDTLGSHNISNFNTLSLNHVVRDIHVHLAHLIDIDVINQLGEALYTNCDYLVMPYHPHVGWRAHANITLSDICKHPVLSRMEAEGRIFGYNLSTTKMKLGDSPVVQARYYSAEAAVSLLGNLGVKRIRTCGVDGGADQSQFFSDLTNFNQERGYDLQWVGIRKSIAKHGLDFAPIEMESPIRIFVGAGEAQLIPALVLKHSILKHATMSVDVTIMNNWTHPMPKDKRNWPRTPFSFQRFMIPEKCNYEGHAIYMDSDMLVFGDVKEIWQDSYCPQIQTMRFSDIDKHKAQFSVMKMNCDILRTTISDLVWHLDNGLTYEELVFGMNLFAHDISEGYDPDWNSLEEYTPGKTKLLHYTEMYNQPWLLNPNHPLGYLWFNELKQAVDDGSILRVQVEDHVRKGYLLPKCAEVLH